MNDKIKINLLMVGATYPVIINREDEEMARKVAKQVDTRFRLNQERFQDVPPERIIAIVAYEFALESLQLKDRNDTAPCMNKIEELTEILDEHFRNE